MTTSAPLHVWIVGKTGEDLARLDSAAARRWNCDTVSRRSVGRADAPVHTGPLRLAEQRRTTLNTSIGVNASWSGSTSSIVLVGPEPERLHGRASRARSRREVREGCRRRRASGPVAVWSRWSTVSKRSGSGFRRPTSDEKTAASSRPASPMRSRSRWRSQPGSKAFETRPVLRPRSAGCRGARATESPISPRRHPGRVLRREEPVDLVLRERHAELAQHLADHPRVLDLLDRAGDEEQRHVALTEVSGRLLVIRRRVLAADRVRGPPPSPPRADRLVVGEVEEGVAPVEEDGF